MKTCGTCIHYKPKTNPETGRVLRSHAGRCGWTPAPITLPLGGRPAMPSGASVWPDYPARDCPCYSEKSKPKPMQPQQAQQPELLPCEQ